MVPGEGFEVRTIVVDGDHVVAALFCGTGRDLAGGSLDIFVGSSERIEDDEHGFIGGVDVYDARDAGEGGKIDGSRRAV